MLWDLVMRTLSGCTVPRLTLVVQFHLDCGDRGMWSAGLSQMSLMIGQRVRAEGEGIAAKRWSSLMGR